jgi:hypothetical protein
MSVQSVSGSSYFATFIDDFYRRTWIFLMRAKSEVFNWFWEFKALVENQTSEKIKSSEVK